MQDNLYSEIIIKLDNLLALPDIHLNAI